jgi:hypothetical protein
VSSNSGALAIAPEESGKLPDGRIGYLVRFLTLFLVGRIVQQFGNSIVTGHLDLNDPAFPVRVGIEHFQIVW